MRKIIFCFIALIYCYNALCQNRDVAQKHISVLCSDDFAGRGYINYGDVKAASWIREQYDKMGLQALVPRYFQSFNFNVNTIPDISLSIDQRLLIPGVDYLVNPSAPDTEFNGDIFIVSEKMLNSKKALGKVLKAVRKGMVPVILPFDRDNEVCSANYKQIKEHKKIDILVILQNTLTWSVAVNQSKKAEIFLIDSVFNRYAKDLELRVNAEYKGNYQSQNVCAYVPGTLYPDSFIILCGHYDHLGKMGSATFYGANDNASGIAMLLDMAMYFAKHPQAYSIAFIAFGAEEAGLLGSLHYVKSPPELAPLSKTKLVFNMDLMGNGEDGATIVNASIFPEYFEQLVAINTEKGYLPQIKSRGKATNSDHYFFGEMGIPSFFMYTMGAYSHYHIPQDNAENLKLGIYYDASFQLIRDFILHLNISK